MFDKPLAPCGSNLSLPRLCSGLTAGGVRSTKWNYSFERTSESVSVNGWQLHMGLYLGIIFSQSPLEGHNGSKGITRQEDIFVSFPMCA